MLSNSLIDIFAGEFLGTFFLVLLGNGVCGAVSYKKSYAYQSGWIVIAAGWGMAVMIGVLISSALGANAHLNPAVSMMVLAEGKYDAAQFFVAIASELSGAFIAQVVLDLLNYKHIQENTSQAAFGSHCTGPTHNNIAINFGWEFVGTGVLLGSIVALGTLPLVNLSAMGPVIVALVVFSIGMSLGGSTGYAINPARDLMPRLVFQLLPYKNHEKVKANWSYSWIPVMAPLLAGVIVGAFARLQ